MRRKALKHILAATDGEARSDAALRVAQTLADRDGAFVEIVSVFTPRIAVPRWSPADPELRCEVRDRHAAAEQFSRVWRQARSRLHLPWPILFRVGSVPQVIAEIARSAGADLVVIGRAPDCQCGARAPRAHTAEQLAIASDTPILALPQRSGDSLPRIAVVALDDSGASHRAAQLTRAVLARHGVVHAAKRAASRDLLALCDALGAELLAVPVAGDSALVRSLMGGQVAELLARARCAVLVTPSPSNDGARVEVSLASPEHAAAAATVVPAVSLPLSRIPHPARDGRAFAVTVCAPSRYR
jgi:nucleotide-binding universal stress UspA family protein